MFLSLSVAHRQHMPSVYIIVVEVISDQYWSNERYFRPKSVFWQRTCDWSFWSESSYFRKPLLCPWYQWFSFFMVNLRLSCNFLPYRNAALSLVSCYFRIAVIHVWLCHTDCAYLHFFIASKLLSHAFLLLHPYLVIHIRFSGLFASLPLIDSRSAAFSAFLFYILIHSCMILFFLLFYVYALSLTLAVHSIFLWNWHAWKSEPQKWNQGKPRKSFHYGSP